MCILGDSTIQPIGPIAMVSNSNVRSDGPAEPIAMVNNSNVRSSLVGSLCPPSDDFDVVRHSSCLHQDLVHVARLRRARQIYRAATAQRVLVLMDIERRNPDLNACYPMLDEQALENGWDYYYQESFNLIGFNSVASTLRQYVFETLGINLPAVANGFASGKIQAMIASEIEKLMFLYGALREQGSWSGVASTIMLYVRTHYSGSILTKLTQVFVEYFSTFQPQSLGGEWMETLRTTHTNWKLATQNEGFGHVSKLLSLLVGAGMVQASSLQFEVSGMKLFSELCVPKFVSAYDVASALCECVVFFVEGGYECIQAGSISPLVFGEKDFSNFEKEYMECKRLMDYATPGNYAMVGTDENAVMLRLSKAIESGKTLVALTKNSLSKKLILDRVTKLQEWESTLKQHRLSSGVRVKPFCAVAFGPTGVGKSTIAPLLMYHILQPNGFDARDEACVMMKAGAKHEENYRTYINGVYYDDFANTKAEFTSESPCEDLLDTVNTARTTARMAALELKNKVSKQPKAVVVSTNVKDLNATKYSEEPASITRRADVFLTFRVRQQFQTNGMLDSKKVEDHYDGTVPTVPDLWEIDVQVSCPLPNPTPGCPAVIGWKDVVWNGKTLKAVDMKTTLQYIVVASRQHFSYQNAMVARSTGLSGQIKVCPECKSSKDICVCGFACNVSYTDPSPVSVSNGIKTPPPHPARANPARRVPQPSREQIERGMNKKRWYREQNRAKPKSAGKDPDGAVTLDEHALVDTVSVEALQFVQELEVLSRFRFSWIAPKRLTKCGFILDALSYYLRHESAVYHAAFGFLIPCVTPNPVAMWAALLVYFYVLYLVFAAYVNTLEENVARQKQAAWHAAKHVGTRTAALLGTGFVLHGLYNLAQNYLRMRAMSGDLVEQAFMHPSDEDIQNIDANDHTEKIAVEHNWANVEVRPLPASEASKTITEDDLMGLCKKNTACVTLNGKLITNAFFVKSNVALVPTHFVRKAADRLYTIVRHDVTQVGGNFRAYLSYQHSSQIPNTDLSMIWIPNGGSWKDLTKYFPYEIFSSDCGARMCVRNVTGQIDEHYLRTTYGPGRLTSCIAHGYNYDVPSFVGMCGSPLVAQKISPMIVGIHIAGLADKGRGFASAIARTDLDYAESVLSEMPSVLVGASEGVLSPSIYGKPMLDSPDIHVKSPVRKLEIGDDGTTPNIEIYGSCAGRATYYSRVVESSISPLVTQVCGVPQKWGKPKFGKGDPWRESLKHSSKPSCGVEPPLLDKAVIDYLKPLVQVLKDRPNVKSEIKPMTFMEVLCGKDGKKFINKIEPRTAIGHPLTGTKEKWITYLDPDDFEGFACPAELDDMFYKEYDRAENLWARGERYHPAFKACLKDEPTPIVKDKVRIIQAAPIVLQMGVRKYFLPIARMLSLFPEKSECAVGLNCMGPDWEEFQAHISKFGKDRILAGDYGKYDLRLPAQITMAAFKVLISMARECGYSQDNLNIMSSIATDICYPTIAFNGDLLQFVGSNPSGQNLTVYINGVGSSLLLRCAFFSMVQDVPFQHACALGTYGDDVKSSVKKGFDQFNHVTVAKFLADRDMVFTMPDKTSDPVPYMNDHEADFLKRNNVYIPELGQHCGALSEDSIFKSLHSNVKSKSLTPSELSATCIDGALREWFYHGKSVYEMRKTQMQSIASMANIAHLCKMLEVPFETQCARWRERYYPTGKVPIPESEGLEHFLGFDET